MRFLFLLLLLITPFRAVHHVGVEGKPIAQLEGIDVSHHQQRIDWDVVVQEQRPEFAFVKATEGSDFTDTLFCYNWEALRDRGIRRGAYHFFRPHGCGYDQALHYLQTVELAPGDLAPVLDIETTDGMRPELMLEEMRIWLQLVEGSLGVRPIVYTNQHFYEKYLAGLFDQYPLWIARYSDKRPELTTGKVWDFWQYTNEGCVDGICKKVDLNLFFGTPEMLDRLSWQPLPVAAQPAVVVPSP